MNTGRISTIYEHWKDFYDIRALEGLLRYMSAGRISTTYEHWEDFYDI